MPIVGQPRQRGRPVGAKAGFTSQLSELQKLILVYLLVIETAMKQGDEESQVVVSNRGIPWVPSDFLEFFWMPNPVHTKITPNEPSAPVLSRALHRLEERELVTAQAEGRGRNRRITHLKFSAPARATAEKEWKGWEGSWKKIQVETPIMTVNGHDEMFVISAILEAEEDGIRTR